MGGVGGVVMDGMGTEGCQKPLQVSEQLTVDRRCLLFEENTCNNRP